jgi:hypothetical protein
MTGWAFEGGRNMHPLLPRLTAALAVAILPVTPAASADVRISNGVTVHRGSDGNHGDRRFDHRRHRHDSLGGVVSERGGLDPRARTDVLMETYGGEWALYNNRTWDSDSYNDWWHDQPMRSFPRWVTSGMCERKWYSADTLRC